MESKDKQFIMNMVMQGKFLASEDIPQPKKKLTSKKGTNLKSNGSNKVLVSKKQSVNDLDDIDDYQNPIFNKFSVSHMEKEEPEKNIKKNVVKKKKVVEKDDKPVKTVKKVTKTKATTIVPQSQSLKKNITQESMEQMHVENIPDSTEASLELLNNNMGDIIQALKQQQAIVKIKQQHLKSERVKQETLK